MTQKVLTLIVFLIVSFLSQNSYSQFYNYDCGYIPPPPGANNIISSPFGGYFKPTKTPGSGEFFPILVVFVQFKDEIASPRGTWPTNQSPVFIDSMIATERNEVSNFWEDYNQNTERISSRWADISRGTFHVISPSGSYSVVLPKSAQEYWLDANGNMAVIGQAINRDIWASVRSQGLTDWRYYDRWKKDRNTGEFVFCDLGNGDGNVDMIYKIHKSPGVFTYNNVEYSALDRHAGYNNLGSTVTEVDTVDVVNHICVNYYGGEKGSGITLSFSGSAASYIAASSHEHLHLMTYTGGHVSYSNCSYGIGMEHFYSPYDMILNGYMTPRNANYGTTNALGDFSSRNTGNGEIINIPLGTNEEFLLANRNKISKWDRVMTGDTASMDDYLDNSSYGKGLYIYHVDPSGIGFPAGDISPQDMECADGYFEWEYQGLGSPKLVYDCYVAPQIWHVYKKKNVLYSNDPSLIWNPNPYGDEISFRHSIADTTWPCWWGIGQEPIDACHNGTDRLFTNDKNIYTKSGQLGDRGDVWKPGYNEMFSPYSSPSTAKWNDEGSGVFIYFKGYDNNGNAAIDIYKVDANHSLESILQATPPSRPMGLKLDSCLDYQGGEVIRLTWNHNMELDMERGTKYKYKRYKIYRSVSAGSNYVPPDSYLYPENVYKCIATVDINSNTTPSYIDNTDSIYSICATLPDACPTYCFNIVQIRYRIQAVDSYDSTSRLSDFEQCRGYKLVHQGGTPIDPGMGEMPRGGNLQGKVIPKEYDLKQNYPNPFNPVTNINYDIPKDCFVTLKIYDVSGREVKTLVNEFVHAGSYIAGFNAGNLSSGIYFYKIIAGNFVQTKRMVLIK
jgi:hypothetical protein